MRIILIFGYIAILMITLSFCKTASIGDRQIEEIEDRDDINEHE